MRVLGGVGGLVVMMMMMMVLLGVGAGWRGGGGAGPAGLGICVGGFLLLHPDEMMAGILGREDSGQRSLRFKVEEIRVVMAGRPSAWRKRLV